MAKTTIKNLDMKNDDKKYNLFDILAIIEGPKTPWNDLPDELKNQYSAFMINRFISSKDVYLPIIEKLSTLKVTDQQHYEILCNAISGSRRHFFDYKSYKKEKVGKDEEFLIFALSKEYEIGKREAKTYINKINESEKTYLKNKWTDLYDQT